MEQGGGLEGGGLGCRFARKIMHFAMLVQQNPALRSYVLFFVPFHVNATRARAQAMQMSVNLIGGWRTRRADVMVEIVKCRFYVCFARVVPCRVVAMRVCN